LLQVPIQSQSMLKYSDLVGPNIEIVLWNDAKTVLK
jgi:hypothetical protein